MRVCQEIKHEFVVHSHLFIYSTHDTQVYELIHR